MQVPRPTEEDKERFRALVPDDPRVEVKPMFGNLGAFVNGNMFLGLFGSDVGVKVSSADEERLRAAGGGPYGPAERPMSGWVTLPPTATAEDAEQWIMSALSFVGGQPPKQSKKRSSSR
jgi:TfoX/Sxy family transcriptional regulator of competence genes